MRLPCHLNGATYYSVLFKFRSGFHLFSLNIIQSAFLSGVECEKYGLSRRIIARSSPDAGFASHNFGCFRFFFDRSRMASKGIHPVHLFRSVPFRRHRHGRFRRSDCRAKQVPNGPERLLQSAHRNTIAALHRFFRPSGSDGGPAALPRPEESGFSPPAN